ncbi:MAG TPA: hypothetical protein ENN19_06860 [Chloroflexi bacterium]|nr:hypothetical protein [Chloroflexota bacterium]
MINQPMHCVNHPKTETYLRCNKCGDPICIKCAVQTPVGYRCPACINTHQRVFYADFRPIYYVVAALVAFPISLIAGWLVPNLGWFALFLGPLVGAVIAEAAHWAIRRRRGPYTWIVVCACIFVGALPMFFLSLVSLLGAVIIESQMGLVTARIINVLWTVVYIVTAVGVAYARLRPGRRV